LVSDFKPLDLAEVDPSPNAEVANNTFEKNSRVFSYSECTLVLLSTRAGRQ